MSLSSLIFSQQSVMSAVFSQSLTTPSQLYCFYFYSLFRLARLMSAIGSTVQRPICSIRRLGSTLGMAPCWSAAVQTRSLWGGEKKYTLFLYLFKKCLLVKRCGSGTYLDCPGKTSHGILCCKLDSGKEPASKCGRSTIHIQKDHCKYKISVLQTSYLLL